MWEEDGGADDLFLNQCTIACVNNKGEGLVRRVDKRDDAENGGEGDADPTVWHIHVARTIMHLKKALVREMTEDKLFNFMIEWCDTPLMPAMGCCYDDCCIMYPDGGPAQQAGSMVALVVALLFGCLTMRKDRVQTRCKCKLLKNKSIEATCATVNGLSLG